MKRDALISDCGKYRYWLTRAWDDERPTCAFVMLNPSTADADIDDPTIRKCIGFAQRLGFGGIVVVNLYSYRATKPTALRGVERCGPEHYRWIDLKLRTCPTVICAWGANARGFSEPKAMLVLLRDLYHRPVALRLLADGTPEHPLMIPYSVTGAPLPVLP